MFKIDSPGATILNEWTEGNPSLGIPATVVSADYMNLALQEELVNVVETLAGITLVKLTSTQLGEAILFLIQNGGSPTGGQPQTSITNAEASPTDVTGLLFDKTDFIGAIATVHIERKTVTQNVQEVGQVSISHDTNDDIWRVSLSSGLDDAGVSFTITAAGQVKYTSDDLTGATYSGRLTIGSITKFQQ